MKLEIELVPRPCWFSNVRTFVEKKVWDFIRKQAYAKAHNKCEICGGIGEKWPVECHEVWHYNDTSHIQTLEGFIALCPSCHLAKHYGYAYKSKQVDIALDQLMKVNNWSIDEAIEHIDQSFAKWEERNNYNWELDLDFLDYIYMEYLHSLYDDFVNKIKHIKEERYGN